MFFSSSCFLHSRLKPHKTNPHTRRKCPVRVIFAQTLCKTNRDTVDNQYSIVLFAILCSLRSVINKIRISYIVVSEKIVSFVFTFTEIISIYKFFINLAPRGGCSIPATLFTYESITQLLGYFIEHNF